MVIVILEILFLENEIPKSREPKNGRILSFTGITLKLLVKIGDPQSASIVLRILEGFDGKANKDIQRWIQQSGNAQRRCISTPVIRCKGRVNKAERTLGAVEFPLAGFLKPGDPGYTCSLAMFTCETRYAAWVKPELGFGCVLSGASGSSEKLPIIAADDSN